MTGVLSALLAGEDLLDSGHPVADYRSAMFDMASWMREMGQSAEAKSIFEKILETDPREYEAILAAVQLRTEIGEYADALKYLDRMQSENDSITAVDKLSQLFHEQTGQRRYHQTLVKISRETGELDRIVSYYQQALEACERRRMDPESPIIVRFELLYELENLHYFQATNEEKREHAIELWERIVDTPNEQGQGEPSHSRLLASRQLSHVYLEKAIANVGNSPIASEMLEKLKRLAIDPNFADDERLSHREIRRLLAIYYSDTKQLERAKGEVKPDVEVGVELLSDEDPENDYIGWQRLASAFAVVGKVDEAVSAWCMIQPTRGVAQYRSQSLRASAEIRTADSCSGGANTHAEHRDHPANGIDAKENGDNDLPSPPHAQTSDAQEPVSGPMNCFCDGYCGRRWTYADDIYVCQFCLDVQFDAACLQTLREGTLDNDVCALNHHFMHVPPWTPKRYSLITGIRYDRRRSRTSQGLDQQNQE